MNLPPPPLYDGRQTQMNSITIQISSKCNTQPQPKRSGTFVWEVVPQADETGLPHLGARVNNEIVSLNTRLNMNCTVDGLTARDPDGWRILRRSMCFLLAMAARRAIPDAKLRIRHSLGDGMFFTLRIDGETDDKLLSTKSTKLLEAEMKAIISAGMPIENFECAYDEAVDLFTQAAQHDKVGLLRHINTPSVSLRRCGDFTELQQDPVAINTRILGPFSLIPYENGCILQLPSQENPGVVAPFKPYPQLMRVHREHVKWGESLGVDSVGELNEAVYELRISDLIQMSEALHNRNYAKIADLITSRNPVPKLILIAGPSSAGKTTSAKRLGINLRINGLRPVMLSTDDYFVGDGLNPLDEDGKPDYEHVNAVDLKMFNDHITSLLAGKPITRRVFDFKAKNPVYTSEEISLGPDDVLLIEGIHGLNPILTANVPRDQKFLIFLSALTQLGIDDNNILSTTDNRLLRRIVRDHLFRGHSARQTIRMWPSVRRGEARWIFPYQDEADVSFNTALDYEIAVLRPFAEPLLAEIKPHHEEYATARRLYSVLANFHSITPSAVPGDSILREYIGGSLLKY